MSRGQLQFPLNFILVNIALEMQLYIYQLYILIFKEIFLLYAINKTALHPATYQTIQYFSKSKKSLQYFSLLKAIFCFQNLSTSLTHLGVFCSVYLCHGRLRLRMRIG